MSFSYEQKLNIFNYLSERGNWQNRFILDAAIDERRKWNVKIIGNFKNGSNSDGTGSYVVHEPTGATVTVKRNEGILAIEDESGRRVELENGRVSGNISENAFFPVDQTNIYTFFEDRNNSFVFENAGLMVRFDREGRKSFFLEGKGLGFDFGMPVSNRAGLNSPAYLLHSLAFNFENAAKEWGIRNLVLLDATKLVISKEIGLEPALRAVNEIDEEKALAHLKDYMTEEYDQNWKGPWQWRPRVVKERENLAEFEKPFVDITEFNGAYVATPRQFFVQAAEGGFEVLTSLDSREWIWSHGHVLKTALQDGDYLKTVISEKPDAAMILRMLHGRGKVANDHRGEEWRYVIIDNPKSPRIAANLREAMKTNLDLPGSEYMAVNVAPQLCLVAAQNAAIVKVAQAFAASTALKKLIRDGSSDADEMGRLFDQGANYKYIEPEAARSGSSFATEMSDAGNHKLLEALRERTGVRDLGAERPALPELNI